MYVSRFNRDFLVPHTRIIIQGSGDVYGTLATDVVSIGGLTVSDQAFGAVTHASDDFNGFPNDGLLGLAFGSIAQSKQPTFFERLIVEKKIAAPMFSVHLARNQASGSEVGVFILSDVWFDPHLLSGVFWVFRPDQDDRGCLVDSC